MADDFFKSGGSTVPVAASEQALSALTPQDLMALPRRVRPDWMLTRYPVSVAEFEHLNREAHKPDPKCPSGKLVSLLNRLPKAGRSACCDADSCESIPGTDTRGASCGQLKTAHDTTATSSVIQAT